VLDFYGDKQVANIDATQAPIKVAHDIISAILGQNV
jgi:hypothetical protein